MRLTNAELERGLIRWTNPAISIRTSTKNANGEKSEWSDPLTRHTGSLTTSPPGRPYGIAPATSLPQAVENPGVLTWLQIEEGDFLVRVFDLHTTRKLEFRHVFDLGVFHRLVIHVPHLDWDTDVAYFFPDLLVRFASKISGPRVQPIATVDESSDGPVMRGFYSVPTPFDGRFIEIIAGEVGDYAGKSQHRIEDAHHRAESRAQSAWGALMLSLGRNALGSEVVLSNLMTADSTGHVSTSFSISVRKQSLIDALEDDLGTVTLLSSGSEHGTIQTALRWYARGMQASDNRDRLLSFMYSIEALVRRHGGQAGLTASANVVLEDPRFQNLLTLLVPEYGEEAIGSIKARCQLPQPPIHEYFARYVTDHKLDPALKVTYRQLTDLRNPAVHGSSTAVRESDSSAAQDVLEQLLRVELRSNSGGTELGDA